MTPGAAATLRLLLVDDDEVDRAAVVRAIARLGGGADVVEACDGDEALARAGEPFDCILLDHNLPRRSGLETLQALRARGVTTPVVVLTGSGDEAVAVAMMKAGAADYVVKGTLSPEALWARIRHAVQLADAARFEQQILGIVSHDLRNPIQAMVTGAEILARRPDLPEDLRRTAQRVVGSGHKASRMIADLLDYTRTRSGGGLAVERRAADLHAVVRDALDELRAGHPGREILHERPGDGACACDVDRIVQIVDNLVVNAVTYGRPDAPVRVRSGGDDPAIAEITVHNEGAPIPPEIEATLFEPFARAGRPSATRRSIGLGLYIVRQLARAHGGDVTVHSTAEDGTRFAVRLPRR